LTQRGGEQRQANVQRLISLAQQFDRFQRQGLFRFLCFIQAQEQAEAEPDVPAVIGRNAVRLMSIHQSKGLEFPVVVLADLGKSFNLADLRGEVILDEEYGLCPQVKPPHTGKRYPSLPFWLARRRELRELLGEELRLLYVAMTRARDTLILSATVTENRFANMWKGTETLTPLSLASARSYADWLGLWFAHKSAARDENHPERLRTLLNWFVHDDSALLADDPDPADAPAVERPFYESDPAAWSRLQKRLGQTYPHLAATARPAKTSVSMLRRRAEQTGSPDEAAQWFDPDATGSRVARIKFRKTRAGSRSGAAADVGSAHHTFLQFLALEHSETPAQLQTEANRMLSEGILSEEEVAALDFEGLAAFWSSDLGLKIRAQGKHLRRELAFTARFDEPELAAIMGEAFDASLGNEFVVIQGVADLAALLPGEIWLVDFKTDSLTEPELEAKTKAYEPQLRIYAAALSRIYRRPVTQCWLHFLSLRKSAPISLPNIGETTPVKT
jgi:ATP-dependent helicase/nuclease subunit A